MITFIHNVADKWTDSRDRDTFLTWKSISKTDSGSRMEATASKVENSLSVGIQCQFFRSSARTAQMACCCSKFLAITLYVEPHLVVTSASSLCCFDPNSACFCWRSRFFSQLLLKASTRLWHLAIEVVHEVVITLLNEWTHMVRAQTRNNSHCP